MNGEEAMQEIEDFPPGLVVLTPLGRRAVVMKHLSGASKRDCFSRLICHYEGGDSKDLVTLQPHLLRHAGSVAARGQMSAASRGPFDTFGYGAKSQSMASPITNN